MSYSCGQKTSEALETRKQNMNKNMMGDDEIQTLLQTNGLCVIFASRKEMGGCLLMDLNQCCQPQMAKKRRFPNLKIETLPADSKLTPLPLM